MEQRQTAKQHFIEWFARNYSKDTEIYDPEWHAERIFRAAMNALVATTEKSAATVSATPEGWRIVPAEPNTQMIDAMIRASNTWPKGQTDFANAYRAALRAALPDDAKDKRIAELEDALGACLPYMKYPGMASTALVRAHDAALLRARTVLGDVCPQNYGHPHDFSFNRDGSCLYCGKPSE